MTKKTLCMNTFSHRFLPLPIRDKLRGRGDRAGVSDERNESSKVYIILSKSFRMLPADGANYSFFWQISS